MTPEPGSFVPLTPAVFHIVLALAGDERHGYGIMREIGRLTGGSVLLGPGTLYRSIQKMLVDGLIEETASRAAPKDDDERRRYYRLTPLGRRVGEIEAERLDRLVGAARARRLLPPPSRRGEARTR